MVTQGKWVVLTLEQKINVIKITSEIGVGKTQIKLSLKFKAEPMCDYENIVFVCLQ